MRSDEIQAKHRSQVALKILMATRTMCGATLCRWVLGMSYLESLYDKNGIHRMRDDINTFVKDSKLVQYLMEPEPLKMHPVQHVYSENADRTRARGRAQLQRNDASSVDQPGHQPYQTHGPSFRPIRADFLTTRPKRKEFNFYKI